MPNFDETLQKNMGWKPHWGQQKVLEGLKNKKEIVICSGRQWGKSELCGYIIAREFIRAFKQKKPKFKAWIVAPSYELTQKVFGPAMRWLLKIDPQIKDFIQNRPTGSSGPQIKINQDFWIQCKSAENPISLLGEGIDWEIVDEAPLISDNVYLQYILPPLQSGEGNVVYIGTPRGKGWFYKKFIQRADEGSAYTFSSIDGVAITQEKLDLIKKEYPDERLFLQEYEAKFVDNAGQVFQNIQDIVLPRDRTLEDCRKGEFYVLGVDLGQADDATVMTVINRDTHRVVNLESFKGMDYSIQMDQIVLRAQRYNNARIVLDTTGLGKPVYDFLLHRGVFVEDYTFTGKTKEELIGKLKLDIANKSISIPDDPTLLRELESFEYKLRNEKTGEPLRNIQYGAPKGYHDDYVISLALACWGLPSAKPRMLTPIQKELQKADIVKKQDNFI